MNPEEPYRDQAERLRRRIEKISENTEPGDQMPPRGQLHRQKRTKTKWKLKYPVIRLLVLLFILLPITCASIISYYHGKKLSAAEKVSDNNPGYESINLENDNNATDGNEQKIGTAAATQNKEESSSSINQQPKNVNPSSQNITQNQKSNNEQSSNKSIAGKAQTAAGQVSAPVEKEKIVYHVVQPKETLVRIALKYYHSKSGIEIIKKANQMINDHISTGQVLKIPLNN